MKDKYKEENEKYDKWVEEVCSCTWKEVYHFIYYKVQSREEAEDITQETYAKALPFLQNKKVIPSKCIGFLKTTAFNILRDNWRKDKRCGFIYNIDETEPELFCEEDFTNSMVDRECIMNALNSLNSEQRRVIELRILKGYSIAETAKILDKKEGNIRVIQHRALQNIAELLKISY